MIHYTGKQVRLRPLRKSDIEYSITWRNDPEIRENVLGYRFPVTIEMEENWYHEALTDQNRKRVIFSIETVEQNKLIGLACLDKIDWIARIGYLGIVIGDKEYQGRKMAGEAMHILFSYAFNCLNLRKVCLEVPGYNQRAIDLYLKFGFNEEGRLRAQIFLDGRYHDLILMGLLAEEYGQKYEQKIISENKR